MELEITSDSQGDVCTVVIKGELDVYSAPRLKEELVARLDSGCNQLVLNMEGVGFVDSSGLGVLVSALRRARERDGGVRIICTKENILKIFRITGLDKVFPIFSDGEEAQRF
ncbi:MAG: anti-sigma B factor antagonist [Actinobacteria bacterium HGW-Actinobacteria-7]|jgi:anti-sigma B factor antagonist|nr:MAG: anti-sigma B factor antagonist [Actinobacteria bacterium HGW-Actinobacteria-7]